MSKDKREAERTARRASRLAERAEERARRKERHAERASERAERLAERVQKRPRRERDLDQSIEDLVDEVTQKAEAWIDEQTQRLFDSPDEEREIKRAQGQAKRAQRAAAKARENADRAERAAEDLSDLGDAISEELDEEFDMGSRSTRSARKARKKARNRGYRYSHSWRGFDWGHEYGGSRVRARKRRSAHLYRDRQRKKICGVCAGAADYFGRPTWEIRLYAVLGLIFIPSVTIPSYFIMYFLMDDKPLFRRVTDRFEETIDRRRRDRNDGHSEPRGDAKKAKEPGMDNPVMNNVQTMKVAKEKFSDIEQRLREMESHVTSSRFELQRELKKISGED